MSTPIPSTVPNPPSRASDVQRFESLLVEHRNIVLKIASVYAWQRDDRLDLAQEIRAQLWRAFGHYDESRRFSTWMYRIALNVAISHVRRETGAQLRFEPLDDGVDEIAATPVEEPDPRLVQLQAFIVELDPVSRALMLLVLDERGHAEIADVLGISISNVATKINRIKQRLRARFDAAPSS